MTDDDGSNDRAQDDPQSTLSRRGFGRLLVGLVGLLGVREGLDNPSAAAKRKKGHKGNTSDNPPPPSGRCPPGDDDGSSAGLDAEARAFLGLINAYRVANGLTPLSHNAQLGAAAEAHSQDMGTRNYTSHDSPEGVTPGQRIRQQGYCAQAGWGENIFWGLPSAREAFDWWKNSPGHNKAMLDPDYDETGIGRAFVAGSDYGWYWTTTFGDCG
jgi:uncharacterized protein YkwD